MWAYTASQDSFSQAGSNLLQGNQICCATSCYNLKIKRKNSASSQDPALLLLLLRLVQQHRLNPIIP
jgi:hypothetical protein